MPTLDNRRIWIDHTLLNTTSNLPFYYLNDLFTFYGVHCDIIETLALP